MHALKKLLRRGNAIAGLIVAIILIVMAVFAPYLTPYDPVKQDLRQTLRSPSSAHLFGTDRYGRDVLTRVAYGSRISLTVGVASVIIGLLGGGLLGVVSGFFGSWMDLIIQRFVDVLMSFPSLIFALLISAIMGGGVLSLIIAIGVYNITRFARLFRALVLQVKKETFTEAARALGATRFRIILYHILPNIVMPVFILATLRLASAILLEASLSYLGLGVSPPTATWGAIVADGKAFLIMAPWISLSSGFVIMFTVLGISLLGDGLRDAFDPHLKGT